MAREAGETHSVRLPPGIVAQVRAATGMPFSKFVRLICMAYLEQQKLERRENAGSAAEAAVVAGLGQIIQGAKQQ